MASAPDSTDALTAPTAHRARRAVTAWPLWAALAGLAGITGTMLTDLRSEGELAAAEQGLPYLVTPEDAAGLDPLMGRIGFSAGLVAIIALLVFAAAWRRRVEALVPRSTAARLVSIGAVVAAAGLVFGYGWRGSLANYLGPESGLYGPEGLFVYYMLTDFGAYIPWTGVLVSSLGMAWMAWVERSISRVLGGVTALVGTGTLAAMFVSGVPGLPGTIMPLWLAITGVWLAVGRSRVVLGDAR